jgi:hypothetical protein
MIACPTTKNTWTASYAKHEQDEDVGVSFKLFNSTMFSEDAEIIAGWLKSRRMSRLPS